MIFRSGNNEVTLLLFFIALLIIIVAAINFTNFSTALTPLRIKSINTQKVLGSSDRLLRNAFAGGGCYCQSYSLVDQFGSGLDAWQGNRFTFCGS